MPTPKNTEPIVLIIVTSLVLYSLVKSKKLNYLGEEWRHHIIKPSMKALKMKSKVNREIKKVAEH
jgi:hypothetical protein